MDVQERYPVQTQLLKDEDDWPHGYKQTVVAELLELYAHDQKKVCRDLHLNWSTVFRVEQKLQEGWNWREKRSALERKYRKLKRRVGRPSSSTVVSGDGEEMDKEEDTTLMDGTPSTKSALLVAEDEAEEEADDAASAHGGNGHKVAADVSVSAAGVKTKKPIFSFKVADYEIPIDPNMLFECYFIYLDMKTRTGCVDDFMEACKLAFETLWQITVPHAPSPPQLDDVAVAG